MAEINAEPISPHAAFSKIFAGRFNLPQQKFEHHEELVRMLSLLNEFLVRDITRLDKIFEIEVTGKAPLQKSAQFVNAVGKFVFGPQYRQAMNDYNKLTLLLMSGEVEEHILRKHYAKLRQMLTNFRINAANGKTNLSKLTPQIRYLSDYTIIKLLKLPRSNETIHWLISKEYDNDAQRFINAFLFYTLVIIISRICLERLRKIDIKYAEAAKLITRIYYGNSLSHWQFKFLSDYNLIGGILFRGMVIGRAKQLLKFFEGGYRRPGSSWTINRDAALKWTGRGNTLNMREGLQIDTLQEFINWWATTKQRCSSGAEKPIYASADYCIFETYRFFIDDPTVAIEVIKRLAELERTADADGFYVYVGGSVMLSYLATDEKLMLYLSEHEGHFGPISQRDVHEVIIPVKNFKLAKCAIDLALSVGVFRRKQH